MEKLKITTIARIETCEEKINSRGDKFYSYKLVDSNNHVLFAISYDAYDVSTYVFVSVNVKSVANDLRYSAYIDRNNVFAEIFCLKMSDKIK